MNAYLTVAFLLFLALIQSTVMPRVSLLGVHPDLVFLVVISWSLLRGMGEGMLWALVSGVALDLISGAPFGVCTLALVVASFVSSLGERGIFRFEILVPILIVPPVTLLYQVVLFTMLKILGWPAGWGEGLTRVVLPCVLINTVGIPIVYPLMRLLDRHTGRERMAW
jgi:rod shape-determining protein MreD